MSTKRERIVAKLVDEKVLTPGYHVYKQGGGSVGGPFSTKEEAITHLGEIPNPAWDRKGHEQYDVVKIGHEGRPTHIIRPNGEEVRF